MVTVTGRRDHDWQWRMRRLFAGWVGCGIAVALALAALAPSAWASFGASFDIAALNADGTPDVQAGSHPYEFATTIRFNMTTDNEGNPVVDGGEPKDISVDLPPGLLANPLAVQRCSMKDFETNVYANAPCPSNTQVGVIYLDIVGVTNGPHPFALFNITPPAGAAVAFGYKVATQDLAMTASLRTGADYGATVIQKTISQVGELRSVKVVIWGVPGDPSHDSLRNIPNGEWEKWGAPFSGPVRPFLRLPTQCEPSGHGMVAGLRTDSWPNAAKGSESAAATVESHLNAPDESTVQGLTGCGNLNFSPSMSVQPDVKIAGEPSGYDVDIRVPQPEITTGVAEADLRKTVVTLPAGVSISPSTADGLGACTPAQIEFNGPKEASCPDNSKVGDVEVTTPLLEHPLTGGVYIAKPYENPLGSLFALYVTAREPEAGVLVKLAGLVSPDPVTGQLTVTFDKNPPLPFTDFRMKMVGGARATLANPPGCGVFTTSTQLTSWATETPVSPSNSFSILTGAGEGPCLNPLPFAPGFSAGTVDPQAGAFTPFVMNVTRQDGQQTLAGKFQIQTPPGLLGALKNVPLCGEPQASQGACATDSAIGHVTVGTGPGPQPYYVRGTVYLTGPYKGAPYGLSIAVPAVAGPFDLGLVVVRAAINIDPADSHLYITTEPIPTVLDGIPIQVRSINATIDRPGFIFNPTNCAPMAVKATIASVEGIVANDSSRFQAGYCSQLGFKPSFKVSTTGKTSRINGASLDAKLTFPAGKQANLTKVKVALPRQLPSRLTTLQKACDASVFNANPDACSAGARIGYARVRTPILPQPLAGPVYFVSHGGEAFPDLVIVLQGDGVRVDVVGATNISKGITSTSFRSVQDVPIESFELYLPQGPSSALSANGKLCASKLRMPTTFVAQDGTEIHPNTRIAVSNCGSASARAHRTRAASSHHRRRPPRHARRRHASHGKGRGK